MIILDASRLRERGTAHEYLMVRLSFPDYYGRNLDVLYDCLTGMDETEIEFVNLDAGAESYFARVLSVFREAAEHNPRLRLLYRL